MIEINFVPTQLRKKKKGKFLLKGINVPLEMIIGLGGGLIILLALIHVALFFVNLNKMDQYKDLVKDWERILPDKQNVDRVIDEMRSLQKKLEAIKNVTKTNDIIWAEKLNILSNFLPKGVWLRKIILDEDVLLLEGSAISREKKEIFNVHDFTGNLKEHETFLSGLQDLELDSIQRRRIQKVEVADFFITTKLTIP